MTKIEDLTNEELDQLVAEQVMEWKMGYVGSWISADRVYTGYCTDTQAPCYFSPTTNIAQAFELDKPGWRWYSNEGETKSISFSGVVMEHWLDVRLRLQGENRIGDSRLLVTARIPLDLGNKTAARCRGRVLCALKACGVTEV